MQKTPLLIIRLCLIFEILSRKATSVSLHDVRSGAGRSFIHCVIWEKVLMLNCFWLSFSKRIYKKQQSSVDILLSQQDYDEESMFKQLLGLKDRHIQVNENVRIIP